MAVVLTQLTEPGVPLTGTLTFGSATVTGLATVAPLVVGQRVIGPGIPEGALLQSLDSPTQVTLTLPAQAAGPAPLVFGLEPITLAQAKAHLRIEPAITTDDSLIQNKITAARQWCETYTKRSFIDTSWRGEWDSFPLAGGYLDRDARQLAQMFPGGAIPSAWAMPMGGVIETPRANLRSVASVEYLDSSGVLQVLPPDQYRVQPGAPGREVPVFGAIWPSSLPTIGAVAITFTSGYGPGASSVPAGVKEAILVLLAQLYEQRGDSAVVIPEAVFHLLAPANWGAY